MSTLEYMSAPDPRLNAESLVPVIKEASARYVTVNALHMATGIAPQAILEAAAARPDLIRKSVIRDENDYPLLMLQTPLSGVADAWHAMRQTAYLKSTS